MTVPATTTRVTGALKTAIADALEKRAAPHSPGVIRVMADDNFVLYALGPATDDKAQKALWKLMKRRPPRAAVLLPDGREVGVVVEMCSWPERFRAVRMCQDGSCQQVAGRTLFVGCLFADRQMTELAAQAKLSLTEYGFVLHGHDD